MKGYYLSSRISPFMQEADGVQVLSSRRTHSDVLDGLLILIWKSKIEW